MCSPCALFSLIGPPLFHFFAAICYLLSGLAFVHAQQPPAIESRMEQTSRTHQSRVFYNVKATASAPLAFLPDDIFVFVL